MKTHDGYWEGKQTQYLENLMVEYLRLFNMWPDGYENFNPNIFTYEQFVDLIETCIEAKMPFERVLPRKDFPGLWDGTN